MANYIVVGVGQPGKYFDEEAYENVINYILNPVKKCYADGSPIYSLQTAAQEMFNIAVRFGKNKGKHLRHSVLSFHEKDCITPGMANNYAQEIIQYYAPEYQIVYAVHNNTDHIHIHFVMNQISHIDGHRYRGDKSDYYAFKNYVANIIKRPVILSKQQEFMD